MKGKWMTRVVALVLAWPCVAFSQSTVMKVGKIRVAAETRTRPDLRFGRADRGTFDGCTADPTYLFAGGMVNVDRVLHILTEARQRDLDVQVWYAADVRGRCILSGIEM